MRIRLDGGEVVHGHKILIAIGRTRNIADMGLEQAGVRFKGSAIQVDECLRTTAPFIYAIGDLIAGPLLAHAATYEAEAVINNILSQKEEPISLNHIPNAIFSDPPIASVGLTAEAAAKKKIDVLEVKSLLSASGKAWAERETEGMMKLVVDKSNDVVLGAHFIGGDAPELIGFFSLLLQKGLTAHDLAKTVFPHPTYSEIIAELAHQYLHLSGRHSTTSSKN